MKRRNIIKALGAATVVGTLSACKPKPQNCTQQDGEQKLHNWKMVTAWPKNFPALGTGANFLAETINKLSGGRITIKVYGGGELVPPLEVFDAVSSGTAQMGHAGSYYWKGKVPEAQFFGAVPFGMNAQEMNAWLYHGGGLELWQELYQPFNLVPFPVGQTGVQMGGWFNKEINSKEDLKGLVMRIPGLGGEVLKRAGGSPKLLPGSELFTALQTGNIDATEWVGPYNDLAFGLYQAAKYYYYPGWHEPTACLEGIVNKAAYDELDKDLQAIVATACMAANQNMLSDFTAKNRTALDTLINEHKVQLRQYPKDVLAELKQHAAAAFTELGEKSVMGNKIYQSYKSFAEQTKSWLEISENAYFKAR
ncbi:TRAP transporter solute receptor, unknown substrate 6 [hydrothermal vent metagenome]|uniref:TRAP-type C4-dicarboxylate transport system, periplasmic component n=1 Tax=hydrothermal vent metagenome TaxID=652676 RepID=A0A3B0VTV4_9ZZZZ